ncbi:MAG TPA: TMEM175 family protein [Chitinophagaceae bacterium]|nr:TMEM175 family protein [Chitinophagaceae bacterium]
MRKGRMEAFSDGVIAIIITIMVLEMKVPHGDTLDALSPVLPVFLSYVLSFIYIGVYWNNHHHMLSVAEHVNGKVLWANTHLLFWLSLVPFTTAWMGENHFTRWPTVLYGIVLFMAATAYYILSQLLIALHGKDSLLARAVGKDKKGVISMVIYFIAIALAFFNPAISLIMYAAVAAIWLIPDRRIEKKIGRHEVKE